MRMRRLEAATVARDELDAWSVRDIKSICAGMLGICDMDMEVRSTVGTMRWRWWWLKSMSASNTSRRVQLRLVGVARTQDQTTRANASNTNFPAARYVLPHSTRSYRLMPTSFVWKAERCDVKSEHIYIRVLVAGLVLLSQKYLRADSDVSIEKYI